MAGRYDLQMVPDPSSPTGFSPQYVYTPATPLDRAREQIGQIGQLVGQLARRGSPIVEGIRALPSRPTLSEALAQPIYDRPSNVPEVTAGQRTARRTLSERFEQNRQDALQRGIAAALQRSVDAPGFDPATERNRREAYDLLSANDPFYADPNPALAAVATGAGQLVGAMQDPTSYIAPGRTMLGRAVGGAGVGGATDVIAQALDIGSGVADQYNPLQTAGATVAPALLSLGGDALARAGRGAPEAAAPEPIAPEPLAPVQPRRRGPSVFDYAAYEAANPMPRPFETAPNLPPPRTYEEAVDQVQSLQAQLNEAYRDVGRSTSVQNPGVSGMRSLDRRAVLERQLAAARTELERLRPPAPERVNPPGTSEAARAYLERLGMGRVAELGSTRAGEPQRPSPDQTARTPRPRAERQVIDATAPSRSLLTPEARTTTQIIRNPSQADLLRLSKNGEELRYFKDPDGNVFVGRAFDLTHYDMLQTTGQPNATQSGLEVGVLARDDGNRFSVIVGSGNTPEDQLVSFPMTREWLRGIENTTPTAPEPLAPVTAARAGEPQAMRRGQRPAGDINAQTQALLDAMEQQANDANLQPSGGNATFQIGERRAPGTWPDRQRPRAPEPLAPVKAEQTPPPSAPVKAQPPQLETPPPSELGFYSQLQAVVQGPKAPTRGSAEQWAGWLKNQPGVKAEELEWTGLNEWLKAQSGPVSRDDVQAYVSNNGVQVEELQFGREGQSGPTPQQIARQKFELEWAEQQTSWGDWLYDDARRLARERYDALPESQKELYDNVGHYMDETGGVWGQFTDEELAIAKDEAWSQFGSNYEEDARINLEQQAFENDLQDPTKWSSYTLPGGKNYTELLLQLPTGAGYRSSHWDQPNVLAHVRFKERAGPNGERILALEEMQSDWHQAGRERGYNPTSTDDLRKAGWTVYEDQGVYYGASRDGAKRFVIGGANTEEAAFNQLLMIVRNAGVVPDAPFKDNRWASLAMKRIMKYAADNGFDGVAWIPGNIQNGQFHNARDNRADFYNKILPNIANDIAKKYGARTGRITLGTAPAGAQTPTTDFNYIPITPDLRRKATEQGFNLFGVALPAAGLGAAGAMQEPEQRFD